MKIKNYQKLFFIARKFILASSLALVLALIMISFPQWSFAQENPNIILIVADDLGYGDLSSYGSSDIQTPNLDKLAGQGVRFTNFYANAPECTPTRTALLTGRYQQRVGGMECALGLGNVGRYKEALKLSNRGELGLPVEFNVLPSIAKQEGYHTAIIGKWHLGAGKEFRPQAHGFDYSIGPLGGAVDYFHHTEPTGNFLGTYMEGDHDFFRNGQPDQRDGYYLTHLITDESVEWINKQKKGESFFLYVPYTTPHKPLQGPDNYSPVKWNMENEKNGSKETYIKMIEDLDEGVGKILKKLKEKDFADNSLVIFFSDNGPISKGSAGPFRGNKGGVFEGGIRVPSIIRWPGKIKEGIVSDQMSISMDLTASIASILESSPPKPLDGIDIIGHVMDNEQDISRTLFWRIKRGEDVRKAVRDGDLKYIHSYVDGKISEYLFNLSTSPREEDNLIMQKTKQTERLKILLEHWEAKVQPERYNK